MAVKTYRDGRTILNDKDCPICEINFRPNNHWQKYCSYRCSETARGRRRYPLEQRTHGKRVEVACRQCGKQLLVQPKEARRAAKNRYGSFCSLACWYAWQRDNKTWDQVRLFRAAPIRKLVNCKVCGKEISHIACINRKYCSFRCYSVGRARPVCVCANCGKPFSRRNARPRTSIFCGRNCFRQYYTTHRTPNWRGNRKQDRGPDWKAVAEAVRDRDLHRCVICGKPESAKQRLDVDHVVPFRLAKENKIENLLSACKAPCHVRKTHAETHLLRGDVLGFLAEVKEQGWPQEFVKNALVIYGLYRERDLAAVGT